MCNACGISRREVDAVMRVKVPERLMTKPEKRKSIRNPAVGHYC